MGFLSDALGLNNSVSTNAPASNISQWQQQQRQLANILMGQANGTSGPNPAQLQYQQNAQQIAQQQAQLNSQNRALNPGLAARLSSNAAVQAGQGAAGGAAVQQAQQQLGSQQLLGNTLAQSVQGQNIASGIQAGIGAGNQQQAGALTGGLLNAAGSAAGFAAMAKGGKVMPRMAFGGAFDDSQMIDGGSAGSAFSSPGGEAQYTPSSVPNTQKKGEFGGFSALQNSNPMNDIQSFMALGRYSGGGKVSFRNPFVELHEKISNHKAFANGGRPPELFKENPKLEQVPSQDRFAPGGKIPAMVSPGELFVKPAQARAVADGRADPMRVGEKIPGKAKVKGNSYENDTVRKNLDVGGIVVPRDVMESEDPEKAAIKFIREHLKKNAPEKSPEKSDFLAALNRSIKGRKAS